ncbi:NAD(P)/FAD-dependent oxidoreductase [Kutzneria sp. 744]|uniref:NAD(P)/FAD-dependent oxidoreductase n=1 Tax=Kutzneria sp. (strain 744) TaxID=345341 RepID=UPI0004B1AEB0|nr:FAD-dependent oxidoreductase [Kutzneria sp. 744]
MNRPELPRHVAVVGAGLAGVSACEQLRELGYDGRLTLFGAEPHLPYDRPPLSKDLLLGKQTADEIVLRKAEWYAAKDIDLRLGTPVTAIRPDEGRIELVHGTVAVDAILLATGGRPRPLPVPGGDHPAITVLRSLDDAVALKDRLAPGVRLGVIGAGLIGAEVAASATVLGCQATLIDPAPLPLEHVVGAEIADLLHSQHRANGVRVLVGAVASVEDLGGAIRLHLSDSNETVDCDVVVVGVGIVSDDSLAASAGVAVNRGVLVDSAQRSEHPRIFAAGDAARPTGPDGPLPNVEHWESALHEGKAAAAAIIGAPEPVRPVSRFWSDRYGWHLEVVGEFRGEVVLRGELGGESFAAFALVDGKCVGAVAVNRPSEMKAARRLIERGLPVRAGHLADESVDLRSLVTGNRTPAGGPR